MYGELNLININLASNTQDKVGSLFKLEVVREHTDSLYR